MSEFIRRTRASAGAATMIALLATGAFAQTGQPGSMGTLPAIGTQTPASSANQATTGKPIMGVQPAGVPTPTVPVPGLTSQTQPPTTTTTSPLLPLSTLPGIAGSALEPPASEMNGTIGTSIVPFGANAAQTPAQTSGSAPSPVVPGVQTGAQPDYGAPVPGVAGMPTSTQPGSATGAIGAAGTDSEGTTGIAAGSYDPASGSTGGGNASHTGWMWIVIVAVLAIAGYFYWQRRHDTGTGTPPPNSNA